jgi:hypothetical protein
VNVIPVLFENGHAFVPASARGLSFDWTASSLCGIVRRRDGLNKPCPGRVRVTLRGSAEARKEA